MLAGLGFAFFFHLIDEIIDLCIQVFDAATFDEISGASVAIAGIFGLNQNFHG